MKISQIVVLFLVILAFPFLLGAQQLKENEVVVISGEKYILHQVRTGETIFSISQHFEVDDSELIRINPKIKQGLKIGDIIKIPFTEGVDLANEPVYKKGDPTSFEFHTIESRSETPYFIAKSYGITIEELYAYNPEVKKFRKGTRLRIPLWEEKAIAEQEPVGKNEPVLLETESSRSNDLITHTVKSGETLYSIARQYNVTESEILFYNPDARQLKAGTKIYLPKSVTENTTSAPVLEQSSKVANYFEHIIESGETLWGITRKYDVSENELQALNPFLADGFPAGAVLKVPAKDAEAKNIQPVNEDAFIKHEVEKGETLYGLSAKYDIKIPEIKKYNPVLETRNLLRGETVLIPRRPEPEITEFMAERKADVESVQEVENKETPGELLTTPDYYDVKIPSELPVAVPESCQPRQTSWNSFETYQIALFLPLFQEANDTLNKVTEFPDSDSLLLENEEITDDVVAASELDTFVEEVVKEDMFIGFYRGSENFVQFYEGVLLAVDSMQQAGMNIELKVFDTQQNADSVRKAVYSHDFLETDLIIGPVFPNIQNDVADIAAKNRIPMVSPLSAQTNKKQNNPYYYQVNPDRDYLAVKTAELVAEEYFNSNFIVFRTSNYQGTAEGRLVELIQEKLYNSGFMGKSAGVSFSVYDFEHDGPFGLRRILSHNKENVIYIPSSVEGELSIGISNINNLADEYSITLIGTSRFPQYESIQIDYFHNLKMEYVSPYWVDYKKPSTINFIEKFKSNFYTEPDNFGIQGYDVTFYFLNALKNYGNDFRDCLPYLQVDLIQGNYQFEKVSQFGGYMNQGVSVISYQRNFDVVRKRVEGQLHLATN
ncbi:LysM peptidoglycan-binding domain-containing protein [Maribellus comscasis]|uniref:LysM peptidoglycan-binding domain-containing protein n=1 Tax=Maribellus comscasis TaxID=2681766 RepID=A0A6I6JVX1_9BACT|nr:LysM peptidoglycan-binding domain-containing protein [Maribellus comscasis]QGY46741.1 LysM peptidoglycan-binding domain-containing protein [Maribellus comscasis]